ncbi:hypothetical protein Zmor_024740 [Zophobas morio]|uniref:Uncharacterized protein n=1 Tax=Zophobas morio TaxID=2755281 RepID=A0AA38M8A2_9CUCU|nr:hypothetical protein Zmor_024740 [Zophobas morio]
MTLKIRSNISVPPRSRPAAPSPAFRPFPPTTLQPDCLFFVDMNEVHRSEQCILTTYPLTTDARRPRPPAPDDGGGSEHRPRPTSDSGMRTWRRTWTAIRRHRYWRIVG